MLQSNVGDACIVIPALNEPGRRRPTRTLAWLLRVVSERPAASLGCDGDAEESELAIVQILLGLLPCGVGVSYALSCCERRCCERSPVELAWTASRVALVVRPSCWCVVAAGYPART